MLDEGPFFHGTKADVRVGDLLTAGFRSNYRPEVVMNHIYFSALPDGAGLAAGDGALSRSPRSCSGAALCPCRVHHASMGSAKVDQDAYVRGEIDIDQLGERVQQY